MTCLSFVKVNCQSMKLLFKSIGAIATVAHHLKIQRDHAGQLQTLSLVYQCLSARASIADMARQAKPFAIVPLPTKRRLVKSVG
jgi:hypothetical protein